MKKNNKFIASLCLLVFAMVALVALPAMAATESYVLNDGQVYRVGSKGEKVLLEEEKPMYWNTDKGMFSWIMVDPELSDAMKGSKSGFYFFDSGEAACGFLPFEGAAYCNVTLNPNGETLSISCGTDVSQSVTLYSFPDFDKKAAFTALGEIAWLDPFRLAFTVDDAKKGSRSKTMDQQEGWLSVAMYDVAMGEMIPVVVATETEDYMLIGINFDEDKLEIVKRSVKNKKDWDDEEKIEENQISVPIPAAG